MTSPQAMTSLRRQSRPAIAAKRSSAYARAGSGTIDDTSANDRVSSDACRVEREVPEG
jgi:hypothetical protein